MFGGRITRGEVFWVIMAPGGVAVLLDFRLDGNFSGYIMGLISAVLAGITTILIKKLRQKTGRINIRQ